MKTKYGGKITVDIRDEMERVVGDGARDIANYCGLIMRTTVSFSDGNWAAISAKHGQAMRLKVKAASAKSKLNRAKQRDPQTGEKATADKIWELQHTRKKDKGELLWSDPQSQEIHVRIQALVTQQQSEENENPMTRDEILLSVLGERTAYVRGKGYVKRPPRKNRLQQADVEASVSSAMTDMHQQMQAEMEAEMDQKLQEEREKTRVEMDKSFQEQIRGEVDKRIKEQMADLMVKMQQGQGS